MITDGLNDVQRRAVEQKEGPILIIAGAGSGKTRTLTYRIAYLLQQGVSPYSIMALTFTNKAAKEMQDRITELVGVKAKAILMGTFHSIFSRILRIDGYRMGYMSNYTIYDDDDSKKLIGSIIKEMNLNDKAYRKDRILKRISKAKCALFSPSDYEKNPVFRQEDTQAQIEATYRIYAVYQRRLRQAMAMDFDDILFNMNVLLRDFPDVLEKYQHRFQYILVDEYQDTNYAQYLIVKKLADYYKNICVVGDDAQSIYSFRGASIENILSFRNNYPDASVYKLEQNYRSTKNIINAANSVIENNENQIPKNLYTDNQPGDKLVYCMLPSDREEALWVADKIDYFSRHGVQYRDMAILYRTNSQSRSFEDCLRLKNIPYIIYGGTSFYARKEIKDCVAYLRLVVNNDDDEAFERIINYPSRGIGQTTIDRLKLARENFGVSLFKTAQKIEHNNGFKIATKAVNELNRFCDMISSFSVRVKEENAYALGSEVIERSGIVNDLRLLRDADDKDRIENIDELIGALQSFVESDEENIVDSLTGEEISIKDKTLDVFLQQVSLITSTDKEENDEDNFVKLMTVHASKGLEFDTVFVAGMEENIFPSVMNFAALDNIEEERRLFYVAITRAKQHLLLSSANVRYKFGEATFGETSRFIKEINPSFIVYENAIGTKEPPEQFSLNFKRKEAFSKKTVSSLRYNSLTSNRPELKLKKKDKEEDGEYETVPIDKIKESMTVYHSKFGRGKVGQVYKEGGDLRAKVLFDAYPEEKTLILKFAKLKIKLR
ncbi:MAG: UvrD-helicase domain-containing protein [Bacteroidales bacterium]|nr:UvrD-helicase domain-containing protein [Bacteroidales bacterium]